VPTMAARRGVIGSAWEVVAEPDGSFEVDVAQLGPAALGGQVHEHPDAALGATDDVELASADQGDIPQAQLAGARGWEGGPDVVGGREQDADDVVVVHPVALAHRLQQHHDPLVDVHLFVDVDGGGTTEGSEGGGHGG